jgi:hypothetical protein
LAGFFALIWSNLCMRHILFGLEPRGHHDWPVMPSSAQPANLCPLSGWVDFAGFGEDFGESIGELVKTMLGRAVRQRAPEHLDGMLSEQQRIDDTVQTTAW